MAVKEESISESASTNKSPQIWTRHGHTQSEILQQQTRLRKPFICRIKLKQETLAINTLLFYLAHTSKAVKMLDAEQCCRKMMISGRSPGTSWHDCSSRLRPDWPDGQAAGVASSVCQFCREFPFSVRVLRKMLTLKNLAPGCWCPQATGEWSPTSKHPGVFIVPAPPKTDFLYKSFDYYTDLTQLYMTWLTLALCTSWKTVLTIALKAKYF